MSLELDNRVSNLERVLEKHIESTGNAITLLSREMKDFKDEMSDFKDEMKDFKDEMKDFKDEMKDFKDEMKDFKDEMKDFKDEMKDFKDEMKDFKDEMKEFKDEMKEFKDEMKEFKDEMKDFKDEMKDFKDEMKEFKDDVTEDRRNMNKQWGSLANKMGTIVEDIILPGIRPAIKKYFGSQPLFIGVRIHKKLSESGFQGEFDIIAFDGKQVYLVEVKSSPNKAKIKNLVDKIIPRFRQLFPEYSSYPIIPIMGGLSFTEKLITFASHSGVYVMGYREWDYLDILNFDQVKQQK